MRKLLLAGAAAALLLACGDNDTGSNGGADARDNGDGGGGSIDAGPDAFFCAFEEGALGGGCDTDTDCDSATGAGDGFCLEGVKQPSTFAPEGYCIRNVTTTACVNDADCGTGGVCVLDMIFQATFCAPACCMLDSCPQHQACWNSFNGAP